METRELRDMDLTKVAGGAVDLQKQPSSEKLAPADGTGSGSGAASSGGGPGTVVFGQNRGE